MKPLNRFVLTATAAVAAALAQQPARADAVTDWNTLAGQFITEARLGTPPATRVMAIVQTAVHAAVGSVPAAAQPAAVAAANRATLQALLPAQKAAIDAAYVGAIEAIRSRPGPAAETIAAGITAGERAAAAVLAERAAEAPVFGAPDATRPHIGQVPGVYVPTALPAATAWPRRTPWVMTSPSQFRPAPPPALTSATWTRDFEEMKAFGARASTQRSAEQTEIARFWDYSLPPVYHGILRSLAQAPGRDLAANARLFATAAQAMDDALIAVFDAKYAFSFWRPVTAIRNADLDGNDATTRDPAWLPLIDTPMHPEYPSGHSILAGALGAVLRAEAGSAPVRLSTFSPTVTRVGSDGKEVKGGTRHWSRIDELENEVAMARVWGGLHFRFTNEVSLGMGRAIGELAVKRQQAASAAAASATAAAAATATPQAPHPARAQGLPAEPGEGHPLRPAAVRGQLAG